MSFFLAVLYLGEKQQQQLISSLTKWPPVLSFPHIVHSAPHCCQKGLTKKETNCQHKLRTNTKLVNGHFVGSQPVFMRFAFTNGLPTWLRVSAERLVACFFDEGLLLRFLAFTFSAARARTFEALELLPRWFLPNEVSSAMISGLTAMVSSYFFRASFSRSFSISSSWLMK